MNFELTDEQKMIRDMARNFAAEEIAPNAEEREATGQYPYDIIEKMAELGMMGIPFPEEYGGSGGDWVGMHLCMEEISRADVTLGSLLGVTVGVAGLELEAFGTHEQKKKWLTPIAKGQAIGAFALTEPNSGSDAGALKTTAVLDGDAWVLNGTKQFISYIGLDNASVAIVAAVTGTSDSGKKQISAFIVPKDTPGLTLGKKYDKMAWQSAATHELVMEDCRIPQKNVLGDPTKGFAQHLSALQTGRICIAAQATGLAQGCLDESLKYSREREQFNQPIFNFQAVQFKLADMAVSIELARNQYIKAAWLKDQGKPFTFEASAAKLYASEMVERVASDAVQIHGGYGYMNEYPVARYYKGAKLLQIVEGTSEVQRIVIARTLAKK